QCIIFLPSMSLSTTFHLLLFFFQCYAHNHYLHSFPTRRSSDLLLFTSPGWDQLIFGLLLPLSLPPFAGKSRLLAESSMHRRFGRSEEHTSELQSLRHLVCRLLLEKKKKKNILNTNILKIHYIIL